MPDARCQMPDARCQRPDARCQMPDARCQIEGRQRVDFRRSVFGPEVSRLDIRLRARSGRNRNGPSGVRNGAEQTLVHGNCRRQVAIPPPCNCFGHLVSGRFPRESLIMDTQKNVGTRPGDAGRPNEAGAASTGRSGRLSRQRRRRRDFQEDRRTLEGGTHSGTPNQAEVDAFARRWGGYLASAAETSNPASVLWVAHALPGMIALTGLPADLTDPGLQLLLLRISSGVAMDGPGQFVEHRGTAFRVGAAIRASCGTSAPAWFLP
jgi:hypothetical protein